MTRRLLFAGFLISLLVMAACASKAPGTEASTDSGPAVPSSSGDSLSGMWKGDWGPSEAHRNAVILDLKWDGAGLTGTVNPGPDAVPLTKSSFVADTGMVMMEADAKGRGGETVHYLIEGKVEGGTMTGSWNHGDQKGDFKITKQ